MSIKESQRREDILHTALALAGALDATVVLDPAGIKGLTLSDGLGRLEGLGAGVLGKATGVAQAGHGCREDGKEGDDSCDLHVGGLVVWKYGKIEENVLKKNERPATGLEDSE